MHLAHGGIRRGEPVRCNLVERELLEGWRACFYPARRPAGLHRVRSRVAAGRSGHRVCAASTAITYCSKPAIRPPPSDRINLPFAVADLPESRIHIVGGELDTLEQEEIAQHLNVVVDPYTEADSTLGYLAQRWAGLPGAINLLQGDYTVTRKVSEGSARWGSVGVLAACWALLAFVALIAQGWWASYKASGIEEQALSLYKDIFPQDTRATAQNVRRRAANRLGEASGDAGQRCRFSGASGRCREHPGCKRRDAANHLQRQPLGAEHRYDGA